MNPDCIHCAHWWDGQPCCFCEPAEQPAARPRTAAWARYFENHPEVVANWAEQNGYEPSCACPKCKKEVEVK